ADEFLLAAKGDHKRGIIRAFHQYDGRSEIEAGWLGLVFGQTRFEQTRFGRTRFVVGGNWRGRRVLFDGYSLVRDSGGRPRLWLGDAGASERGRDFRLLAHLLRGRRSSAAGKSDDLRGRELDRKTIGRGVARVVVANVAAQVAARRRRTHLNTRIFRQSSGDEERVLGLDRAFFDAQAAVRNDAVARKKDADARRDLIQV